MGSECNHPTALLPKQGSGASVDAQAKSTAGSPLPSQSDQQSHDDGSVHQGNESTTDAVSSGATAIPIKKTLGVATDTGHDATLGRGALPRIVERLRRRRVMADSGECLFAMLFLFNLAVNLFLVCRVFLGGLVRLSFVHKSLICC